MVTCDAADNPLHVQPYATSQWVGLHVDVLKVSNFVPLQNALIAGQYCRSEQCGLYWG